MAMFTMTQAISWNKYFWGGSRSLRTSTPEEHNAKIILLSKFSQIVCTQSRIRRQGFTQLKITAYTGILGAAVTGNKR